MAESPTSTTSHPRESPARTRSSTSCTSAASRPIPRSGVRRPAAPSPALAEKIGHLKDLGITAVELLPIDEFDETDCPFVNPLTGERNRNFWGYNTIAYAAPKAALRQQPRAAPPPGRSSAGWSAPSTPQGLEVVLDVVFNHTAEGGEGGPTYSFRGLDNSLYYLARRPRPLPELHRLRQHGQQQPPDRPQPDPGLPAQPRRRGARRRLPLRPGQRPRPRQDGATSCSSRRSSR